MTDTPTRKISVLKMNNYEISSDFSSEGYFILFLADSSENLNIEKVSGFMDIMLKRGMVYLCSWGRNCELIHDIADRVICSLNLSKGDNSTVLTTWHKNEEISEALWYALNTAVPAERYCSDAVSVICAAMNEEEAYYKIKYYTDNPDILDRTVLGDE